MAGEGGKSFARRDRLLQIEHDVRKWWDEEDVFRAESCEKPPEPGEKFFGNFPYPYMNGYLHLGHAFSLSKLEFAAAYHRLRGANVLCPFAFHCTGMPIKASADKLAREIQQFGDPPNFPHESEEEIDTVQEAEEANAGAPPDKFKGKKSKAASKSGGQKFQWEIMRSFGLSDNEISKFQNPYNWLTYFPPLAKDDLIAFGLGCDWRRSFITTDMNPFYDSFVRWQMRKLKSMGKIVKDVRYTIFSPLDGQPCADHDRASGEGVQPQEYTIIKMELVSPFPPKLGVLEGRRVFLAAATLRPETMYGQTNAWVLPDGKYGAYEINDTDVFILTQRAALNLAYQKYSRIPEKPTCLVELTGYDLIGLPVRSPLSFNEIIYALPMLTILTDKGTGIVTSVPSDAPDDYMALHDLKSKPALRAKYGVKDEWVLPFEIIPIINIPEFGDRAAEKVCMDLKIKSQNEKEKLADAKKLTYLQLLFLLLLLLLQFPVAVVHAPLSVMGRRKQSHPHRSGGVIVGPHDTAEAGIENQQALNTEQVQNNDFDKIHKPYFVEVDRASWNSHNHLDISEVVLTDLNLKEGFSGYEWSQDFILDSKYALRFRMCNVNEFVSRIKLGHWPVLSSSDISLEFVEKCTREDTETHSVILAGSFDGPDEGISGLVHLASLNFMTLRPVLGVTSLENKSSLRVRVEILRNAFEACESLLENTRQVWKRSMVNVMAWLRPEVMTSEARYGVSISTEMEIDLHMEMGDGNLNAKKQARFDAARFYEAIKPSKVDPMLEDVIPDLLPELRPYQRRAAHWMVQREKGDLRSLVESEKSPFFSPLCLPVDFLDTRTKMFYNPFSGNISLHPEQSSPYVFGGILADEMGLGKTVELLACIFAHRKSASECGIFANTEVQFPGHQKINLKRLKRERVECICGAVSESRKYKGLWVQCDICDSWQHADCVGYSPKRKRLKSSEISNGQQYENGSMSEFEKHTRKQNNANIVVRDGEHICPLCLELIQATESPVATGATLIVCPAPILPQWHAEIIRHTHPGSLKTCIYEGVKITPLSNTSVADISELVGADIVLTTYDVLKEDLSHDSDRHEGDRRLMRFQKRYPVVPTPLTRIFWWRICLDEAQMVECNAAAATEMALRLHAKHRWCITGTPIQRKLDDLFGLLRFLKASPFDVSRWWIEVIRDPYERRDTGAMEFTHKFLKQIMWRSSKRHVADELQLPPQEECVSWLTLSPIEEHFYQRQHETCVSYAREVIEHLKDDLLKREFQGCVSSDASSDPFITHAEAGKLLNTLLKLRQACCHPQVGSSGLRSLQQSPMTMEEILMVLIGKTKIEGEEALRRIVVALNGLAGIAIIENKFCQAVSLYKEALSLVEEHSEDFRLDPLLNIHIHHNLDEILPLVSNYSEGQQFSGSCEKKSSKIHGIEECDQHVIIKRQKVSGEDNLDFPIEAGNRTEFTSGIAENGLNGDQVCDNDPHVSSGCISEISLRSTCENIKQKYLSVFSSKLSIAQQEFRKSYMQVSDALRDRKDQHTVWWLEVLHQAEQNKEFSSELLRKIEEAISGKLNNSRSSRIASRFQSISSLKYHIQTGLDLLEASRKVLLDRLLEIDHTMEKPKEEDIERVRYCRNCIVNGDGPLCVSCELDGLFQDYEARLFRLNKEHGGMITSAEEAIDLQKRNSALNRFYWNFSQPDKDKTSHVANYGKLMKRDVGERVVVSKSSSEFEIVLGVIKSYCKAQLGREGMPAAMKQLHILEGMRKEYAHARSLAIAQAQFLCAHDEVKMATTRLHLRENEDDRAIDALSQDELPSASVQFSDDKFISLTLLSRTKGKLRYLKGLVLSKQKSTVEGLNDSSLTQEIGSMSTSTEQKSGCAPKADEETCPVCQEKLSNQKMVFQCGHVTCCKCLFSMTERRALHNKFKDKWVMCPTCRQHTDFGNIAYVDDRQNESCNSSVLNTIQGLEKCEASMIVQGSYGTKIEAVTRRILWIKHTDPIAKILVFSSWNDVLDVLEHAFTANDISFIRMKGGRKAHVAISKFRGQNSSMENIKVNAQQPPSKNFQVLLILIQHGANGLNLLEAQHVVLIEPLLNPAAEAQAISRVHRIGQENKTLVHRFIVKNTVEESLYKLNRSRNTNSFISGNTKNQDQPVLTLKDVESLFATVASTVPENEDKATESLRHLPPSVAAGVAAERRLKELTSFAS